MSKENEKIKEIRKYFKLTQQQLADKIGVSKQYLSRVENGYTELSKEKVTLLCDSFGISYEWFFGNGQKMLLKDEEINEAFVQDIDNLNNLNKVLKVYNMYLKKTVEIIQKKYTDAAEDNKFATANILFNQDLINEKISFADIEETNKNLSPKSDFETRVLLTYYPLTVQK